MKRLALVVAFAAAAAMAAAPRNPNTPALSADSDFVRAMYAASAQDVFAVLMAREAAAIAGDEAARGSLDAHAEALGLSKLLAGTPAPQAALIRDVVNGPAPRGDRQALRTRLLETTLRPKLAHRSDGHALYPARDPSMFLDYRYEGRSVWSSRNTDRGTPYWVYLRVEIENAGPNEVKQFDARLAVRMDDGRTVHLDCKAQPWFERALRPGEGAQHVCSSDARHVEAARLVAAVGAIEADASRWKLEATRINFVDPPLGLGPRSVFWLSGGEAHQRVVEKIKAAPCSEKGSCVGEIESRMRHDPVWGVGILSAALGIVFGIALRLLGSYRWRAARAASALSIAAFVIAAGAAAAGGGMNILAGLLVGVVGGFGLAVFNAVMWATLGVLSLVGRGLGKVAA